ncbi:hypothetical protein [Streptomyces sp. AC550_RSS872]|uniref:hypothetical protein n=1 Tax=Streptomyces sp. AC550_RSS872 TaxID=2823689 RepID=UPI0027E568C5|nr:hypothetical protein [Streptomyces sp. AC550_RSS872]
MAATAPDRRSRFFFKLHIRHGLRGEPKAFSWRDNLNVHPVKELADFAAADLPHLTRVIKWKLKKIQSRPHLLDGCLPPTGLT